MRVLGIDPGSRVTGYGVIDVEGSTLRYVASGGIHTEKGRFVDRLAEIFRGVSEVVARHGPVCAAVEEVFQAKNPQSAIKLGQARGAAIAALARAELDIAEYAARRVKLAVTGSGGATKFQVQHMMQLLLHLDAPPPPDAADALAVAICHVNTRRSGIPAASAAGMDSTAGVRS